MSTRQGRAGALLRPRLAVLGLGCALSLLAVELLVRGAARLDRFQQERANRLSLARGGRVRILCIGESTTAGSGGASTDSYPFQLGELLRARGFPASVVNAGRAGADSTSILSELETNLDRYQPHLVVAMMGINDRAYMQPAGSPGAAGGGGWLRLKSLRLIPLLREAVARRRGEAAALSGEYLAVDSWDPELYGRLRELQLLAAVSAAAKGGRYAEMEAAAREALRLHPGAFAMRVSLAEALTKQGRSREAEEVLRAEAAARPEPGRPSDGEAVLAGVSSALVADPRTDRSLLEQEYSRQQFEYLRSARFLLLDMYRRRGETRAAEELRERMRRVSPDYLSSPASPFQPELKTVPGGPPGGFLQEVPALFPATARNFSWLRGVLDRRGIRLVLVQYPRRDVRLLKALVPDARGVVFVDNKTLFDGPLRSAPYGEWFVDSCYVDFGHGTRKGNRLLAKSVADALAQRVLPGLLRRAGPALPE